MHVHILGICGTFMGGVAALSKAAGHRVTGSDRNVYPPMSTQLEALGIEVHEGYGVEQLDSKPDVVVVGNVMARGMPVVEALLEQRLELTSGPDWLGRNLLRDRWVLAVAGTHGKTSTSSLLVHLLEEAGLKPGFLVGGVPANFGVSARLGEAPFFVIEADEYDTAFFDKRAKFIHYRPQTLILNNLEFDHADIYPDLESIKRQFNHLLRTVPCNGLVIHNARDHNLNEVLARGCWSQRESFAQNLNTGGSAPAVAAQWTATCPGDDPRQFLLQMQGQAIGLAQWTQLGAHNVDNALAAIAAARHAGVPVEQSLAALASFRGVKRRMERLGEASGITVYDDFAHHPTAIATTVEGLKRVIGKGRVLAVLEARSHTMKMGVHKDTLAPSLAQADEVFMFAPADLGWDAEAVVRQLGSKGHSAASIDGLIEAVKQRARSGDHVLVMSNGSFGGLHQKLLQALKVNL